MTAVNVSATGGTDTDDIVLAGSSLEVDTILASGSGDISLTASSGAITDADANSSITADDFSFSSTAAVGSLTNRVNTSVTEVLAGSSTGAGGIFLNEANDVVLTSVSNSNSLIDITAGNDITAVNVATTGGTDADDILLTAQRIEVGSISAAGAGDVLLTAGVAITDTNADSTVTADQLSFSSSGGVGASGQRINTTVIEVLSGSSSGAGGIYLSETNDVVLTSVSNSSGVIDITAGGAMTAVSVATTGGTDTDDIALSGGSVEVGTISAGGTADVTLTATSGTIDDVDGNSLVTADDLTFSAVTSVGDSNAINTTVNEIVSGQSNGVGDINLNETNDVLVTSLSNASGAVSLVAGGLVTAVSIASTGGADTHDIVIQGASIEVDNINAAGVADVTLTATTGSIDDTDNNSSVTADDLSFSAATSVGSTNPINVTVNEIVTGQSTGVGDINLNETNDVLVTSLSNVSGAISLTAGGAVTAGSIVSAGGADTHDIVIQGSSIEVDTINAVGVADVTMTATTGSIDDTDSNSLISADDLTFTAATSVGNTNDINTTVNEIVSGLSTGVGDINLNETNDVLVTSLGNVSGAISLTAGGTVTAVSIASTGGADTHDIVIQGSSIEVDTINAAGVADVTLTATTGSIDDTDNNSSITGDDLTFTALTSVGGTNSINTTVSEIVSGQSTGVGDIHLNETDDLVLTSVGNASGLIDITAGNNITAVNLSTTGGTDTDDILLSAQSIELGSISAAGAGDILLTAGTAITDTNTDSSVAADQLSFASAGAVGASGQRINTTVAEVFSGSSTGAGGIYLEETDDVVLTSVSNSSGVIDITAGGAITAVNVSANGGTDTDDIVFTGASIEVDTINAAGVADVTLTATTGSIDDTDSNSSIAGDDLTFTAVTSVGGTSTINTTVSEIVSGQSTGVGGIFLNDTDDLVLTSVSNSDGLIDITAGNNITAVDVSTTGGTDNDDILLSAQSIELGSISAAGAGDILLTAGIAITDTNADSAVAADDFSFSAFSSVGATNPIRTTVSRILNGQTSGAGTIRINETNDLILDTLISTSGDISVTIGGDATITGDVSSGSANMTLTVNGGITHSGAPLTAVTANLLTIDAGAGVTLNDTNLNSLDASVTSIGNFVLTNESNEITLLDVDTQNGRVDVTAGGTITALDVETAGVIDTDLGDILLTSTGGGIVAGALNAGTLGDVTLDAQAGPITDDAGKITADVLTATAAGSMNLDTTVSSVNANTSAAGNLTISESDNIDLTSVVSANGAISVSTATSLTATSVQSIGSGNVSLNAQNMTLGLVDGGANTVSLTAGSTINSGTVRGAQSNVSGVTIGLTTPVTMEVGDIFVQLSGGAGGISGDMIAAGGILTNPPPPAQIEAPGTVILDPFRYLPADAAQTLEGLSALSTLAVQQEKLEKQLRDSAQAQFFMTPPLEIYIDIEEEGQREEGELPEEPLESLEEDFSRLDIKIVVPPELLERGPRMPTLLTPEYTGDKLLGDQQGHSPNIGKSGVSSGLDGSVAVLSQ